MTGRYLFKKLRGARGVEGELDRVRTALSFQLAELEDLIFETGMTTPRWGCRIIASLKAKTIEDFCGGPLETKPRLEPGEIERLANMRVPASRKGMLTSMFEWNMVEKLPVGMFPCNDGAFYMGIFAVPKSNGFWRIIFDCRWLNAWLPRPPPLHLATITDIFRTVGAFQFFAVWDYRQFFYSIGLPDAVRNLFLMACEDQVFRAACLCMGLNLAPWLAQNLSMLLAVIAVQRAGMEIKDLDLQGDSSPRFLVVMTKRGIVVGRIVFWLDNGLLCTNSERVREEILRHLFRQDELVKKRQGVVIRTGVVVKEGIMDPDNREEPTSTNTLKGVELSERGVKYLNIQFRHGNTPGCVEWKHSEPDRWIKYRTVPRTATCRNWAGLIGVLMWHWQLSGEDKGSVAAVIELSRELGSKEEEQMEDNLSIGPETRSELQKTVDELFSEEWNSRESRCMPKHMELGASDASGRAGAGVGWKGRIPYVVHFALWSEREKKDDINVRETRASLSTANAILDTVNEPTIMVLGTDNVTAKAAMTHGMYPGEKVLTEELQTFKRRLKADGHMMVIMHIPGRIMAADAPSRLEPLDQDLCERTRKMLFEFFKSQEDDEKMISQNLKRYR